MCWNFNPGFKKRVIISQKMTNNNAFLNATFIDYSTVTLLAKLRGLSTSKPLLRLV